MEVKAEVKYRRKSRIGAGQGMNSEVFLADDPQLGGEVVVKEVPKSHFRNDVSRFFDEAKAIFASQSPNIVPIFWACETSDRICLAMPFLPNGSLGSRIEDGPLSPKEAVRVGEGICRGLLRIHQQNLVHFDVKPTNVLFDDNDVPMVADFGQTQRMGPHGVATIPPLYVFAVPPEAVTSQSGVAQSDVYQTGLTLYRAINGDPFYNRTIPQGPISIYDLIAKGKFPDRSNFQPHVPDSLRRVIRKAMHVDVAKRYGSASDLAEALGRIEVSLNWEMTVKSSGNQEWRCCRDGRPNLVVTRSRDQANWIVQLHTERDAKQRAFRKDLWSSFATEAEADKHLTTVFASLA